MHTFTASALLLSAAANAAVMDKRAAVAERAVAARAENWPTVWKSPDGKGETTVRFSDESVYVGGCTPESIIATVGENCFEDGFCNPEEWTMQCVQGDAASHTITMKAPEGQYQSWIRNGLVDAMQAAIKTDKVTSSERINAMSGGGCVGCPWTSKPITVYNMPSYIGIAHANEGQIPDVITLTITNNDAEDDAGLCEILTGLGGAIAGSVNGVAGGIFGVGGVACKAI